MRVGGEDVEGGNRRRINTRGNKYKKDIKKKHGTHSRHNFAMYFFFLYKLDLFFLVIYLN